MKKNSRDEELITMILEHCQRIEDACHRFGDKFEAFDSDLDFQDVINMNIFQIGELANQISESTKTKFPNIPWHQVYGIRNIMAHAYIQIDNSTIWETVKSDIPKLKQELQSD